VHPVLTQTLASQHIREMRAAAPSHRRITSRHGTPASAITQRVGWALVHVGLRLATRHARA
jgi:hypothetical protein